MLALWRPFRVWERSNRAQVDLPLLWIAAEPLLTLFSRELRTVESVCRLWDFFLIEGKCPFAKRAYKGAAAKAHHSQTLGISMKLH